MATKEKLSAVQLDFVDLERSDQLLTDVEKLLKMAEELQEKCDQADRMRWNMTTTAAAVVLLGITGMIFFVNRMVNDRESGYSLFATVSAVYAAGACFAFAMMSRRFQTRSGRDRRALYSIVDMLRELEGAIVKSKKMTVLQQAEFRIRLSRFDIGPGHSSVW